MDWLQFLASIVGSLAWPAALVTCVLVLRRELMEVMKRLRRLRYGEAQAEFGEKLEEAEEEIAELPVPRSIPSKAGFDLRELESLNRFSNNSAVFIAWLEVESAVLNLARAKSLLDRNMLASRAAELLLKHEWIDHPTYDAIRELQALRNIAVHPNDARIISTEEANRFRKLADKVAAVLEDRRLSIQ
jgi:hypothetical protein